MNDMFDWEKFGYKEAMLFLPAKGSTDWRNFTLKEKVMFNLAKVSQKIKRLKNGRENQVFLQEFNAEDEDIVI